ncbi:MAG: ribosome biogenesis GTP-binding protein YihA/YsxC [Gammaproteobacteria bacterium]|nr:ribosome biogenesis GTP-binding protein YihA/YsxC [Gammaproteobacteria bacterium]
MKNPLVNVRFGKGATSMSQLPSDQGSEIAFAGRSNAGKSSAINTITGRKGLARTSKTPGRTQEINTFVLDDQHRIVDLPGFGYARVPDTVKRRWQRLLNRYLEERRSLRGLVFVMDVRRPLRADDSQFLQWCQQTAMPVHVLLTKCDKFSRGRAAATLQEIEAALQEFGPHVSVQLFSSTKRQGVEQVQALMVDWLGLNSGQKNRPGDKGRKPGA